MKVIKVQLNQKLDNAGNSVSIMAELKGSDNLLESFEILQKRVNMLGADSINGYQKSKAIIENHMHFTGLEVEAAQEHKDYFESCFVNEPLK